MEIVNVRGSRRRLSVVHVVCLIVLFLQAEAAWYQESGPNGLHPARLVSLKLELFECTDANEYTPLSEAGAGGATEVWH